MREGHESRTAVLVCMGRAAAHGRTSVARYADPTALALLPDGARAAVERFRAGEPAKGLRARAAQGYLAKQSQVMVLRTVAIDDALREAAAPQVVLLGAGLDGRAWRLEALRDATVFEVDHPDSQRTKRERAAKLGAPVAREVRFVPVDFTRDRLDDALAAAGHDPSRPTAWVWEGVVMYLTSAEVESTLAVVARRSATGSRLAVLYHRPARLLRWVVGFVVGRLGEPLRSSYTADAMRALLARHGFDVARDDDVGALAATMAPELAPALRFVRHLALVVADRR